MRTIVERMLPASFLVRHAIYMQTCAHIELASWHIVQLAQGFDPKSPEQVEKFLKLKIETRPLLKALKDSAKSCQPGLAIRILNVASRINEGLLNRNLAAHGAWFFNDKNDALAVEHYWRDHDTKQWAHVDQPVTLEQIDEAIDEADLILQELIAIKTQIQQLGGSTPP